MYRFFFSGQEILFTAEQQLEAAGGVGATAFVTVKVTLDEKGQSVVEAFQVSTYLMSFKYDSNIYQVSEQCMEMVAEGVLEATANLGSLKVNSTFTAVVQGKNVNEVSLHTIFLSPGFIVYSTIRLTTHFS